MAKDWIGQGRDFLEGRRTGDMFTVTTNTENTFCADFDVIGIRYFYEFKDGEVWSWSSSEVTGQKDALKKMVQMRNDWGSPIALYADQTETETAKQAIALAEHVVRVVFSSVDGVGALWILDVEPEENAVGEPQLGYAQRYVRVSDAMDIYAQHWK